MNKISDIELINFAPEMLKDVNYVKAYYKVSQYLANLILDKLEEVYLFKDFDKKSSEWLDNFNYNWHVDYYNENLSISDKALIAENVLKTHILKGTPFSIKKNLEVILPNLDLVEWYDYGGEPFHFKLVIPGQIPPQEDIDEAYKIVRAYKNARSILDGFIVTEEVTTTAYVGLLYTVQGYQEYT